MTQPSLTATMVAIRKKAAGKVLVKSLLDEMVDAAMSYEAFIIARDADLANTLRSFPFALLKKDVQLHTGNEDEYFELEHVIKALERKLKRDELSEAELKVESELKNHWGK